MFLSTPTANNAVNAAGATARTALTTVSATPLTAPRCAAGAALLIMSCVEAAAALQLSNGRGPEKGMRSLNAMAIPLPALNMNPTSVCTAAHLPALASALASIGAAYRNGQNCRTCPPLSAVAVAADIGGTAGMTHSKAETSEAVCTEPFVERRHGEQQPEALRDAAEHDEPRDAQGRERESAERHGREHPQGHDGRWRGVSAC
jgi:hypothetical protein